jgi:hypothetical protein
MNEWLIYNNKTIGLYTTLYYGNLKSYRFWLYGVTIIRLHVSEVFKEGYNVAIATHSTLKPTAEILYLLLIFVKVMFEKHFTICKSILKTLLIRMNKA